MSIYSILSSCNAMCLLLLPMLGRDVSEYPGFQDCFLSEDRRSIVISTRAGGPNRNRGSREDALMKDSLFVRTWDDENDPTCVYYEFRVPEQWECDFLKISNGKVRRVSDRYVDEVKRFYPSIAESGFIDLLLRGKY